MVKESMNPVKVYSKGRHFKSASKVEETGMATKMTKSFKTAEVHS